MNERAPVTLYHQLKETFADKIKSNEWRTGSKIPAERQLCEIFKVSRITIRQALDELEKEGCLFRKQGKGTFVTVPKIEQRLSNFYSFSEEIAKQGYNPGSELLDFRILICDEAVASGLKLEKGTDVYAIKRLRLADSEPFAIETSYLPCSIVPDFDAKAVTANGLYNTLRTRYGIIPDEAVETFEAVLIKGENAADLQVARNSPGLMLERFTVSGGKAVEFCRCLIRGDRYKYSITLK